eukprot:CAMPEP_0118965964 /NCGR_PEP_ID=MMETSP1173-20130426/3473_1 /TAXON_ID=1034831 /ORGANISM="Rhizochromulina marina cf, Strain CCMP1243" /LENGTH=48 /DNA_ID= /DNA_START= /DNA_END= /DNA_ORIENTATION=
MTSDSPQSTVELLINHLFSLLACAPGVATCILMLHRVARPLKISYTSS